MKQTDKWDNLPPYGSIEKCPKCGIKYAKDGYKRLIKYHDGKTYKVKVVFGAQNLLATKDVNT